MSDWKKTACILCECNCGIEVQLGGEDGRRLVRFRGDKDHPASRGYACEKPQRLDYYQNGRDRLTSPLRRRDDGTFEAVSWDVAITGVASRLAALRDEHGGESIFYYGGGGQGNHLPGAYASATRRALGSRYRSNALAQEKTGEFWVSSRMLGTYTRGDFEHCEVALFLGKNPWHSHGIPRARVTLKEIARDPARTMIVIDPRRSETAALADIHLQVKPGTDAWLLLALSAVLVEEGLLDQPFLDAHTDGLDEVLALLGGVDVAACCARSGVPEAQVREAAGRVGRAASVAVFEDLGVQMNHNSTLVSYLHRFVWLLTGNFGKSGTQYVPTPLVSIVGSGKDKGRTSPVAGARIVAGLVPCNVIAEEILTDHPARYRAMIVDAANPAHSLADSQRVRESLRALDCLVVIDVAMTETARLADWVLPASSQYEKAEATFFNFEFPNNYFHLRRPLMAPPEGPLSEAEIHTRLVEALGALDDETVAALTAAAADGLDRYAQEFFVRVLAVPQLAGLAPVLLYRTLGDLLPDGLAEGAVVWGAALRAVMSTPESLARAGFGGGPAVAGQALFSAILDSPSGLIFAVDEWESSFGRLGFERIQLALPDLLEAARDLLSAPESEADDGFPFVLSAGERRSYTANTILRDPAWRRRDGEGALRLSPADAAALEVGTGDALRVVTRRSSLVVSVEVSDTMQPGHVSLPNGLGLSYPDEGGGLPVTGAAPNELTASDDRDPFVGTPWHKCVRARLERV